MAEPEQTRWVYDMDYKLGRTRAMQLAGVWQTTNGKRVFWVESKSTQYDESLAHETKKACAAQQVALLTEERRKIESAAMTATRAFECLLWKNLGELDRARMEASDE